MTKALIVGVNGQDGSYLAELLLEKGYEVTGWVPAAAPVSYENIEHLLGRFQLVEGDLSDQASLMGTLEETCPDEIYNLASPSFPAARGISRCRPGDITGLGVTRLLEAHAPRDTAGALLPGFLQRAVRHPGQVPQYETTPFHPRNPYGIAKLYAHWTVVRYRERYGLHACCGILFNHESPRRGEEFVTRKIGHSAASIKLGLAERTVLGDLEARRDWGYAGDYVRAMWLMLQHAPDDYVIGTGQTHSVRQLCELAFACLDLDYRQYVVVDPQLMRPPETTQLVADPSKARRELGWQPTVSFEEMVRRMVSSDYASLSRKQ